MRAVLCTDWGEPEQLSIGEIETPTPGSGEIAIAVHAAGVNFADTLMIAGTYQVKPPLPFSPGLEVAGQVTAIGSGVTRIRVGDSVMALTDGGGYAETALANENDVFVLPGNSPSMDMITAAGFPITYGTAHGGLTWRAGLKAGETLLVHGAAGGVGLAAVEVGKALGATVIATAGSAEKLAIARAHGADHGINYRNADLRKQVKYLTAGRGADVVFDPVGGEVFDAALRCVAWGARIVIVGFAAGRIPMIPANVLLVKNVAALGFYWGSYRRHAPDLLRDQFAQLFDWFQEGKLQPLVSHRFDLSEAAEALALLKTRKSTGKVVLTTGQGNRSQDNRPQDSASK